MSRAPRSRARQAWQRAGLEPVGLHDCRHSYAAFMIAAGVNPKALCRYMGHSSITVRLDRYGHLLPGNEHQAAQLLDSYLAHNTTVNRNAVHNRRGRHQRERLRAERGR